MRTITTYTNVYKFDELPEEAKRKALEHYYDINVSFDWWDSTYDDAKMIGCTITEFNIDRGSRCGLVCKDAHKTARLIVENHGEECDTYKLAKQYLKDYEENTAGGNVDDFDGLDALDAAFQRDLSEEYLSILRQEYEYRTSEEAIKEMIEANDYDFTIEGRIF